MSINKISFAMLFGAIVGLVFTVGVGIGYYLGMVQVYQEFSTL